ncbi:anthranilate synthase component II [Thermosulfidibacter takaii ABI70S6]|uniref:Anthranilate synthase component II n=1 Tax=Thermosulfidibacter takaii (strain DSM 17441 / JCM 13301 / NBRC 103674 / ABI70S6) TaxID=1298851 RepID=A0A0S3QVC5_THET7|nr:aminodeoxychorismate/anthranilate synthase component II [Thermosulfidibacter takaii]BAT72279.1 anthranilate synthase component II [Thermosulfidibacter takaii ABI70S6]
MLLLVDNYDSFTYNLYALFKLQGVEIKVIRENQPIPEGDFRGVIFSPGPSNPEQMSGACEKLKVFMGKIPVFGVCLGMQIIAYVLGHEVSKAKTIQHGKEDRIEIVSGSRILQGIPDGFSVVRYHSLSVKLKNDTLTPVAYSYKDSELMAVENPDLKLYGVQFHPESVLSQYGDVIAKNFIEVCYEG